MPQVVEAQIRDLRDFPDHAQGFLTLTSDGQGGSDHPFRHPDGAGKSP